MIRDDLSLPSGSGRRSDNEEAVSDTESPLHDHRPEINRRSTVDASVDVCFPAPGMSELGEEDDAQSRDPQIHQRRARRRRGQWPDLSVLEEWRQYEKEDRSEERRVKRITEPQLINGGYVLYEREFQSTIHSQTISELVQLEATFESFYPSPRILSDDESSDNDGETISLATRRQRSFNGLDVDSNFRHTQPSIAESRKGGGGTMSPNLNPMNHSRRVSRVALNHPEAVFNPLLQTR
ncbi:hypothetical protein J3459_003930 [Metarhizium acridum]|nr:hypothetical protein J3459_003930 [Metarhizium acridum]